MHQEYRNISQIFTPEQIESLRKGGRILRTCHEYLATIVRPGVTTLDLDRSAEEFIRDQGGIPGFKGYRGFPATLCTSINDECVHGIPGDIVLQEGDIIAVDCGVIYDDLYTDACVTHPVGSISSDAQRLLRATEDALYVGLNEIRADVAIGDIGAAVHRTLQKEGFDVMRALTGHGLGTNLHQFPDIPNFGTKGRGPALPLHTVVAIEPISTAGSTDIIETGDHWTLKTADGSLSAHFEHTVLVTEEGYEILA